MMNRTTTTPGRPASTRQRLSAADAYAAPLADLISRLGRRANPGRTKEWLATTERGAAAESEAA